MKYETVKTPNQLKLEGVSIKAVMVKETVKSLEFTDSKGNAIIIQTGTGYSEFSVMVPAAPEKVKKFQVSGEVAGVPVSAVFEHEFEAKDKQRELERATNQDGFAVEPIEIEF